MKNTACIWITRYIDEAEHYPKSANLEQFYKGYLHFGCSHKKTNNGKELQKFDLAEDSDPEDPTYVCKAAPEGCKVDDDCHYEDAFWCSCSGESCVRYNDKKLASGTMKTEVYAYKGSGWAWQGCKYWFAKGCYCSEPRKYWKSTWRGDDRDNALRDVHSMLLEKKRRDQAKRHHLHC